MLAMILLVESSVLKATEGSKARFPKMGLTCLYLPAYYNDGEIRPAGDAFILTREGKLRKLYQILKKRKVLLHSIQKFHIE